MFYKFNIIITYDSFYCYYDFMITGLAFPKGFTFAFCSLSYVVN